MAKNKWIISVIAALIMLAASNAWTMDPDPSKPDVPVKPKTTDAPKANVKKKMGVEKSVGTRPSPTIPPKQEKAVEAAKEGVTAPSYDPDHGPLLN